MFGEPLKFATGQTKSICLTDIFGLNLWLFHVLFV